MRNTVVCSRIYRYRKKNDNLVLITYDREEQGLKIDFSGGGYGRWKGGKAKDMYITETFLVTSTKHLVSEIILQYSFSFFFLYTKKPQMLGFNL